MFQRSYPHHFLWSFLLLCLLLRLPAAAAPPAAVVLLRSTACRRRRRLCRRHCYSLNACRQLPFSRQDPSGTYLLCVWSALRVLRGLVWWSYAVVFALCFEFQDGFLGVWFWRRSRRARSYLHSRRANRGSRGSGRIIRIGMQGPTRNDSKYHILHYTYIMRTVGRHVDQ